ncbi:transcription factor HES-2-like [Scleropages formosus]|uniref:Hes family bHLH transcription factor 2 n=1 Tax=Scleropages formosus TaxID=113540 RepID=A0A8C9RHL7_SCLFO|nr:transcription factor HES-2-like [Scleropages formosus]
MAPSTKSVESHGSALEMTKRRQAIELRKTMKPLMEKRRRARINESLNHLKTLILPLTRKDKSRYSKLEKADVLEMTVRFLKDLTHAPIKSPSDSYREGYKACLQRVSTLLPKTNLLDADTSRRLNEYIQQAMTPCQSCNCSGETSRPAPQMNSKSVQNFRSSGAAISRFEAQRASRGSILIQPQPAPQAVSNNVWRPW